MYGFTVSALTYQPKEVPYEDCVIGAGGMGGSFGALMAQAGLDVTLIDTWAEHVEPSIEMAFGRGCVRPTTNQRFSDHRSMKLSGPIGLSPLPIATHTHRGGKRQSDHQAQWSSRDPTKRRRER